ncbi:hypothetical protein NH286_00855 [Anaerococcus sp. NML200574]|uniref:hypothetical protein n=1 Tax=Anaerococcus sp. NML200574 TaxID=2954486 RepID=UPI002238434C|nr:hypothetical protein [Anaerococcus sp. NML200574]MCW6677702.1 hypothetical protein [Anaerococcus sp. NML200574]
MIIKEIIIKEGIFQRKFIFDDRNNLIYSNHNSCGKTTLLRCILYGFGYKIPPTKNFKFSKCETELLLSETNYGKIKLFRYNEDSITLEYDSKSEVYVLPEQHIDVLKIIFDTENIQLLNNILGAHYFDQEKGWTLLNRGVVIGSIRFNIEELVRGLNDVDCSKLIEEQKKLKNKIEKYKQIDKIIEYKNNVEQQNYSLLPEDINDKFIEEINELNIRKNLINKKIYSINKTLKDNKQFKNFISKMHILIKDESGKEIKVTSDNIVGLNDSIELLVSKKKIYESNLVEITKELEKIDILKNNSNDQLAFIEEIDPIVLFDTTISNLTLNEHVINESLKELKSQLKSVNKEINSASINNNSVTNLTKSLNQYAKKLGLEKSVKFDENYLFTSNLKELSGAVLHKTVFAFKLAYIIEIQKKLNIKLPIILDSPSGKEIDKENIQKMLDILKDDFKDNQIIIASIYEYSLPNLHKIKLKNRMIELEK